MSGEDTKDLAKTELRTWTATDIIQGGKPSGITSELVS